MAATYVAVTPAIRRSDRFFYTGVGLYVLLLGLAGFSQTFYHTNLLEAAAFRLLRTMEVPVFPTVLFLTFLPILAGVLYDLATRGRVHPIYLWGGTISIGLGFFRHAIVEQPWWIAFAMFVRELV